MAIAAVEVQVLFSAPNKIEVCMTSILFAIIDGSGALAEQLRSGLQNRVDGCDSRTCLHEITSSSGRSYFCYRTYFCRIIMIKEEGTI